MWKILDENSTEWNSRIGQADLKPGTILRHHGQCHKEFTIQEVRKIENEQKVIYRVKYKNGRTTHWRMDAPRLFEILIKTGFKRRKSNANNPNKTDEAKDSSSTDNI